MRDLLQFDAATLRRYDRPGPRYTSYPTAPQFGQQSTEAMLREHVKRSKAWPIPRPLSVYVHVPFCFSSCFYCGCNRIITRDLTRAVRTSCWIAALLVYVYIVSIARAHHPLGVIALVMR